MQQDLEAAECHGAIALGSSVKFTCWGCCAPKIAQRFMQLSLSSATAAAPKINPPRSMMACSIRVLQKECDAAEYRGATALGR
eukprot:jgi/Chrzof1/5148/Cz15g13100.t1